MKTIDLDKLLKYFEDLKKAIDEIYHTEITWDTVEFMPMDLGVKHPDWVKAHFPLVLIYWRPKAGALRKGSGKMKYQNHNNILTQLVPSADNWGIYFRKNKSKGYSNIVGAIQGNENDFQNEYGDRQKLVKYVNWEELRLHDTWSKELHAMCKALAEVYPCDAVAPLKLI